MKFVNKRCFKLAIKCKRTQGLYVMNKHNGACCYRKLIYKRLVILLPSDAVLCLLNHSTLPTWFYL